MAAPPAGLPSFDRPAFAARFGAALHRAGVPVTPERSGRFLDVLHLLPPVDRPTLYWAARLAFVTAHEQIEPFDRVFAALFGGQADPADTRGPRQPATRASNPDPAHPGRLPDTATPRGRPLPGGALRPDAAGRALERPTRTGAERLVGSTAEALAQQDFGTFGPGELDRLDRLLDDLAISLPLRRTRRREADPQGRHIDLRRSLRRSLRTGGETVRLARSHGRLRRRPLVLLCDVSGSMEPYTRVYVRFFSRLCTRAGSGVTAEIFVFATRLTRLTPVLRHTAPDTALRRAGRAAPTGPAARSSGGRSRSSTTASDGAAWPGERWW
ncbi:VWA domain-containing protein [Kitasatospora aburaviensis]